MKEYSNEEIFAIKLAKNEKELKKALERLSFRPKDKWANRVKARIEEENFFLHQSMNNLEIKKNIHSDIDTMLGFHERTCNLFVKIIKGDNAGQCYLFDTFTVEISGLSLDGDTCQNLAEMGL